MQPLSQQGVWPLTFVSKMLLIKKVVSLRTVWFGLYIGLVTKYITVVLNVAECEKQVEGVCGLFPPCKYERCEGLVQLPVVLFFPVDI